MTGRRVARFRWRGVRASALVQVAVLLIIAPAALVGCLGTTAAVTTALVLAADSDDSSDSSFDPAPFELGGPFVTLDVFPADIALGEFVPDPDGVQRLDVGLISVERRAALVYRGDGRGGFALAAEVPLGRRSFSPSRLAVVPAPGQHDVLVVATTQTIATVQWNGATGALEAVEEIELDPEQGQRDLAVGDFDGDFDGDETSDVAVSSRDLDGVNILRGSFHEDGTYRLSIDGSTFFVESPLAIAAANFDQDRENRSDLAVITKELTRPPAIELWISDADSPGGFRLQSRLEEPDLLIDSGARLVARDEGSFGHADSLPDLLAPRERNIVRVLVRGAMANPFLDLPRAPSGARTSRPTDLELLHLPRAIPSPTLWDMVATDDNLQSLIVSYANDDAATPPVGVGKDDEFQDVAVALPGSPVSVAAGDVDADGLDDLVVATSDPATLAVLLSRPPVEAVEERPFAYASTAGVGEDPPRLLNVETVSVGRAGPTGQPFVATLDNDREVVIVLLDEAGAPLMEQPERYVLITPSGGTQRFDIVGVADLDGRDGDDIVLVDRKGGFYLLRSRRESPPRFEWIRTDGLPEGQFLDVTAAASLPVALDTCLCESSTEIDKEGNPTVVVLGDESDPVAAAEAECTPSPEPEDCVRLSRFFTDDLDGDGQLDIGIAASAALQRDFLAVVLAPLSPALRRVDFYRVLDDPRHVAVTEWNGDAARDLLVAIEGSGAEDTPSALQNKVVLLFGDPSSPGSFFDFADIDMPGFIAPLVLDGFDDLDPPVPGNENERRVPEVEFVNSDWNPLGGRPHAEHIIASGDKSVYVYRRDTSESSAPERPRAEGPFLIYCGADPETIVVADIFPETEPGPDLLVGDEDNGFIVVFENTGAPISPAEGAFPCKRENVELPEAPGPPWRESERVTLDGRPDAFALFESSSGGLVLFSSSKLAHIERWSRTTKFERKGKIEIEDPRRVGERAGLTAARESDGGLLVAAVVEDLDVETGVSAVDILRIPPGARIDRAFPFPSADGLEASTERLRYEIADGPGDAVLERVEITAALLGHFSGGDTVLDLLLLEQESGQILLQRGAGAASWPPFGPGIERLVALDETLVHWERLQLDDRGEDLVVIATVDRVLLLDVRDVRRPELREVWSRAGPALSITTAVCGWVGARRRDLATLRVAIRIGADVVIAAGNQGELTRLRIPNATAFAWGDVDRDGLDDLVCSTPSRVLVHPTVAGRTSPVPEATTLLRPIEPHSMTLADVNLDGRADAILVSRDGSVLVLPGDGKASDGTGYFVPALTREIVYGREPEAILAIDADGDGDDDLLIAASVPGLSIIRTEPRGD